MSEWNLYPNNPLPSRGQIVLIWNPLLKEIRIAYFFGNTFEEWERGKQIYTFPKATYWMPLPSPPPEQSEVHQDLEIPPDID